MASSTGKRNITNKNTYFKLTVSRHIQRIESNSWAECDVIVQLVKAVARIEGRVVVVRVGVCIRAGVLEEPGVGRGRTRLRRVVGAGATILRSIELGTGRVAADNHPSGVFHLQLPWANGEDVGAASRRSTPVWALRVQRVTSSGSDRQRQVEAIHVTAHRSILHIHETLLMPRFVKSED